MEMFFVEELDLYGGPKVTWEINKYMSMTN